MFYTVHNYTQQYSTRVLIQLNSVIDRCTCACNVGGVTAACTCTVHATCTVTVPVSVHVYARPTLVLILRVWTKPDLVHHVQLVVGRPRLNKRPGGVWLGLTIQLWYGHTSISS